MSICNESVAKIRAYSHKNKQLPKKNNLCYKLYVYLKQIINYIKDKNTILRTLHT